MWCRSKLGSDDASALPAWSPGAHIDVILPDGLVRQYSLCGAPEDRTRWRIGVLLEPEGRGGSSFIHNRVRAGDALQVAGPRNNFALGDAEEYLFIAGGIGITRFCRWCAPSPHRGVAGSFCTVGARAGRWRSWTN